ncbi:hypothetical protein ASE03_32230 [Kitasatospora sp. Root187]|nr:hypothetical protein ASE03_32230 [Kitasatospora sp. Root187]
MIRMGAGCRSEVSAEVRMGAGGILAMGRLWANAPAEWTVSGRPAVRATVNCGLVTPHASHSAARPSSAAQSAAESIIRASARPSEASASYAADRAERVGRASTAVVARP